MQNNCTAKDFFWGAMVGGAIAALTTLLFTTKQGKKIQDKIVDAFEDVENYAKEGFCEAKEMIEEATDHPRKKAHQHGSRKDHKDSE